MMTLIIGGSGSGKSAYAEDYIGPIAKGKKKYYIATMQVFDAEGQRKIERHRRLRSGKGFVTIEQPLDIEKAADKMESKGQAALLECMSNLVANEMFRGEAPKKQEEITLKVVKEIAALKQKVADLVIVSNNVFEDGVVYEETTMEYIRAMGNVNEKLAAMADTVIEVAVGIPLLVKPGRTD